MKKIKFLGLLAITLLSATGLRAQNEEKGRLIVPLTNPGKPFKLEAGLLNGSITVTGYEGKDIIVETEPADGKRKHEGRTEHGMKNLTPSNSSDIEAEENNNEVDIHGSVGRTANLIIKIPMNQVALKLHTVNNGNIIADNINGDLEINNVNGYIQLHNISGSVVANTVNGKVEVTFKTIDPKAAMAFSTFNGSVDVTFPAGLKANIKLKSDRGEIFTDFDVITEQRKPAVTHSEGKGMYSLKVDDWVYGKIDGGGQQIMLKNYQGNIYIRKVK